MPYFQTADGNVFRSDHPEYHTAEKRLSEKDGRALYVAQTRRDLAALVKPNSVVYTVLRHVSASGMSRRISLFVVAKGGMRCIDGMALTLGVGSRAKNADGIVMGGAGMDMGFHAVYLLGSAMWPNGTKKPHGSRNGQPDTAGGYALKQRWL